MLASESVVDRPCFAILLAKGVAMRKDADYAVAVLQEVEDDPLPFHSFPLTINPSHDDLRKYFHLQLLVDAGFLVESGPRGGTYRLTDSGCGFLGAAREPKRWKAVLTVGSKLGDASLRMLGDIAIGIAKDKLRDMGLPIE